jgi:membrane associated rhomboid family serine protease
MIPLRDDVRGRSWPVVTLAIIAINAVVFLYSIVQEPRTVQRWDRPGTVQVSGFDEITDEYGFVPCELRSECRRPGYAEATRMNSSDEVPIRVPRHIVWLTLLTAVFMHAGWLHIIGNMLFLWVFGNNVEDAMGHAAFLLFYLLCGLAATLAQWATDTSSEVVNIGASGAIAGVLGGYILLHPRARVLTAVPLLLGVYLREIPAVFVLGSWFALQIVSGSVALAGPNHGGVAYFAHIGGFAAGMLLVRPFSWPRRRARAAVEPWAV